MNRKNLIALLISFGLGAAIGGVVGVLSYNFFVGGNSTPSRETSDAAPTLSLDGPTPTLSAPLATNAALEQQVITLSNEIAALQTQVASVPTEAELDPEVTEEAIIEATEEAAEETSAETPADTAALPDRALYRITEEESEVRFKIDEILLGNPTTVTAATRRVAGDVIVNFSDPSTSQLGTIAINARTFRTDNEFRDQSIRGQILQSSQDEYEFINFAPTSLEALSTESASVGDTLEFQVIGDLTIRDVTNSVTFDVTATVVSEDRLEGFATAQILYDDFGINIQAPPTVSDIGDTVIMELDFVALRVEE